MRDEQRELVELELRQRLAEIELTRETEAVDRTRAVLAEIDLVHVGVQQVRFVVAHLQRDRHQRLAQLAPPAALVRQEIAAHELLRERARALPELAAREIDECGACDRSKIDAVMLREAAILDGLQRRAEQRRNLLRSENQPILAVRGKQAANQKRIQPDDRGRLPARVPQRGDPPAGERDRDEPRGLDVALDREAAGRKLHAAEADAIRAGACESRIFGKAQPIELRGQILDCERASRIQLERRGVDLCGQVPAASLELPRDRPREERTVEHGDHERAAGCEPEPPAKTARARARLASRFPTRRTARHGPSSRVLRYYVPAHDA